MTVKTAVSLDAGLFEQAETMAGEMKVSRSRLIGLALSEFIRMRRNRAMLEQLNAAYADGGDDASSPLARLRRASHRRLVEGTW